MHALLFGATESIHDYHLGSGSFQATVKELRAAAEGLVTTPVTRSNFRNLGELPALLTRLGVSAWRLTVVSPMRTPDPVAPRLAMVAPHALRAVVRAEALGLWAAIAGLPLCLMGPYADRSLGTPDAPETVTESNAEADVVPKPCRVCEARATCGGISANYLALFGDGELRARPAVTRRPPPAPFPPLTWKASDLS